MANQDRVNFIWANTALTTIPPIPVSEVAYRDTTQTPEQMEVGQQYDTIYNSARHNQLLFLLTSVAKTLCENGIMPFLAGQKYAQYARCIFTDGKVYYASRAIEANESPYPTPKDDSDVWIVEDVSENFVPISRQVIAGTGLTGGGALSGDVTLAAKLTDSVNLADSTTAASATAVKAAYDQGTAGVTAANAKLPLTGGTMLGSIQCGNSAQFVVGTQEEPFYQMRARIFGVHSPAGMLCGIMTADAAANYFSIEPTGGAIVNSYCGRPGSAFQHGYFANMNGHPLAATIIGVASGEGWFYRKYSDGFIEQWGMAQTAESGDTIITFPTPFLNGIYNIQLSSVSPVYQNDFYNVSLQAYSYSTTSFYVEMMNGQTKRLSAPFAWYACGFKR